MAAPPPFLLTRTLHPGDYLLFRKELKTIEASFGLAGDPRHWEFALALHAIDRWLDARGRSMPSPLAPIYAVGEDAHRFTRVLEEWTHCDGIALARDGQTRIEEVATGGARLAEIVTCLSVLEHVPDLERYVYYLTSLVAPGGLLVLTFDYWNHCGADQAVNHETRARIFCPKLLMQLRLTLRQLQCELFGGIDPHYHGPQVHDYTFASLVVEKRR